MSEEQYATKRERQKARRAQRLEREAAQAKVANRKRQAVYGGMVVLVIALIGGLVYSQIAARQARTELARSVGERLEELGCTEQERMPDLGGGHIATAPDALAVEPPDVIYGGDEPPSSGRHVGQVAPSGIFDAPIDPRLTTHNLEHGYVIAHYAENAPADQVAVLKEWAQDAMDGDFPKMIVTPYYEEMSGGANFAFTAWFQRQLCDTFDSDVLEVFLNEHYDIDGEGPEKGIPTHNVGQQGVLDPEGEALLLPPLDAELDADSFFEDVEPGDEELEEARPEFDPDAEDAEDVEADDEG